MRPRTLAYLVIWLAFFEQLFWSPLFPLLVGGTLTQADALLAQSAFSMANLFGNALAGVLADRHGRRAVVSASLVAAALTGPLHLAAATPEQFVAVRLAHGLAVAGIFPGAVALVGDSTRHSQRGGAMAVSGIAIAIASALSTAISGAVARGAGLVPAVAGLAAVMALMGAAAAIGLPRFAPVRGAPAAAAAAPGWARHLVLPLFAAMALMFGQNVLFASLPLQVREMGLSPAITGALFSTFGVAALLMFALLGRAADRWGRRAPLLAGFALVTAGQWGLALGQGLPVLGGAMALYGTGFGLVFPAIAALAVDAGGTGARGRAAGLLGAAFSLGAILGPLVSRSLAAWLPPLGVTGTVAGLTLLVVALHRIKPAGRDMVP